MPLKILIVEDNPTARVSLEKLLATQGFLVESAGTLREAHDKLDGQSAIILDLDLPDGNGVEILKRIRKERKPVKVVVATGTSDPQLLDDVKQLGPDALLTKPLNPGELMDLLHGEPDKPK